MDSKTEVMVALGAAMGANCIPCFDFLYARAREVQLEESDIRQIVDIAFKVKNGASTFLKNAVHETIGGEIEAALPCNGERSCACG